MQCNAKPSMASPSTIVASRSHRAATYRKVPDQRKHTIRGLWRWGPTQHPYHIPASPPGILQKFRMLVPTMIGGAPALEKLGRQVLWC